MSNLPPPPPPPASGPPPPPPRRPYDSPHSAQPSYGVARPAPTGLRKAASVLMWVVVASWFLMAVAAFSRKSTWDDFIVGTKNLDDLDNADGFIGLTLLLALALMLATTIVLAVWSNRTVSNAQALGANVKPGLAAGGWFIPIGWFWVGFGELRKALAGRGDASSIAWWQGLWVVSVIACGVALRLYDSDTSESPSEVSSGLRNQSIGILIAAMLLTAATLFAMRALRSVDEATSGA